MNWGQYILLGFVFASLFFIGGALALYWAHRHGQLDNLEKGARSIFDEDEPEGEVTDAFPVKKKSRGDAETRG